MNKLNSLTKTLNKIEDYAREIISEALPIMEELKNDDTDLVDEVMEKVKEVDRKEVLEILQDVAMEMAEDAETVVKEMDKFSETVVKGENEIDKKSKDYPFLFEVWSGDVYDECEIGAMKELQNDLKKQLSEMNEDTIIKKTIEELKK